MSQQLELLTENPTYWGTVSLLTPEIQKKEIKPFVILALKELEGNPDARTSSLMNADKFSAVREVVRHFARLHSATKEPWVQEDVRTFLEGLRFSPDCVAEFTTLLCIDKMYENVPSHLRVKPGLASLQWKIDVSLSQTNIASENPTPQRAKELMHRNTHIILIMQLTDGKTLTFRLVASLLSELFNAPEGPLTWLKDCCLQDNNRSIVSVLRARRRSDEKATS